MGIIRMLPTNRVIDPQATTNPTASPTTNSCPSCCTPSQDASAVGPGGKSHGADPDTKAANIRQLRRIEGQVRGILKMVEDDRYCADIITQVSAARQSLSAVARNLMSNHLRHCAAAAFNERAETRDAMVEELLDLVRLMAK